MPLQNINLGTAANDGTGDDARTAGSKINSNFTYLDNLISSIASEVENAPYFDMAALYADQGNQNVGKIQYVLDASAHPDVSSAEARHFEYLGTTVGDHTDYRLLSSSESSALANPAAYKTFLIESLQDDGTPLTTVSNQKISFEYNGVNITGIIFNSVFTDALANFYNTNCNLQFYNITTGVSQTAGIASGDWTTVNTDYYRIAITPGDILLADLTVNDRVEFFITQGSTSGAVEGTAVLSTGEVGGSKFLREDGDGTCSWQAIPGGGDLLAANNLSDVASAATSRTNLGIDTTANQTDSTDKRFMTDAQESKLDGIEALADVTDATNVDAAGAVMESDTTTASMSFVIDEDNMASDSATKVPTQQSVKAYVDTEIGAIPVELGFACSDETTDLAAATSVLTFRMPYAMTLTEVRATVGTAPTGSAITVDINETATTILSTKITIDATEKTSETAAVPPVISDSALADDAEITIDIDGVGSTIAGAGLKVWLIGTRT